MRGLILALALTGALQAARIDVTPATHPDGTFTIQPGQRAWFNIEHRDMLGRSIHSAPFWPDPESTRVRFSLWGIQEGNPWEPQLSVVIGGIATSIGYSHGRATAGTQNGTILEWQVTGIHATTAYLTGIIGPEVEVQNNGDTPFTVGASGQWLYFLVSLHYRYQSGHNFGIDPTYIQLEDPVLHAPEPSTWAMLLTGCGMWCLRSLRRTSRGRSTACWLLAP